MTKIDFIANAINACEVLLTARVSDVEEPDGPTLETPLDLTA